MTKQSHRINVENGQIDEIVIRHGARVWLHMEQMSSTHYWMMIGDAKVEVVLRGDKVKVDISRGEYAAQNGRTDTK